MLKYEYAEQPGSALQPVAHASGVVRPVCTSRAASQIDPSITTKAGVGEDVGVAVGVDEGALVGDVDGCGVGVRVGVDVGTGEGLAVGVGVGLADGAEVGVPEGDDVGLAVGHAVDSFMPAVAPANDARRQQSSAKRHPIPSPKT